MTNLLEIVRYSSSHFLIFQNIFYFILFFPSLFISFHNHLITITPIFLLLHYIHPSTSLQKKVILHQQVPWLCLNCFQSLAFISLAQNSNTRASIEAIMLKSWTHSDMVSELVQMYRQVHYVCVSEKTNPSSQYL